LPDCVGKTSQEFPECGVLWHPPDQGGAKQLRLEWMAWLH
jgi:hypothetical protein